MFRPVTHGPWSPRALTAEGVASVAVHNCTNPSMAQKYIACFKSPGGEWCLRGNTQEEQGARERQSNIQCNIARLCEHGNSVLSAIVSMTLGFSEVKLADNFGTLKPLDQQLVIERLQVSAILLGSLQLFERLF